MPSETPEEAPKTPEEAPAETPTPEEAPEEAPKTPEERPANDQCDCSTHERGLQFYYFGVTVAAIIGIIQCYETLKTVSEARAILKNYEKKLGYDHDEPDEDMVDAARDIQACLRDMSAGLDRDDHAAYTSSLQRLVIAFGVCVVLSRTRLTHGL